MSQLGGTYSEDELTVRLSSSSSGQEKQTQTHEGSNLPKWEDSYIPSAEELGSLNDRVHALKDRQIRHGVQNAPHQLVLSLSAQLEKGIENRILAYGWLELAKYESRVLEESQWGDDAL